MVQHRHHDPQKSQVGIPQLVSNLGKARLMFALRQGCRQPLLPK